MSLNTKSFYYLQTFWGFFQVHFYDFVKNSAWKYFLPIPVDTDKAKLVAFLVFVCTTASFIGQISCSENVSKRDAILAPVRKQWIANSQGYSELQEPIKTREKCYSPIW